MQNDQIVEDTSRRVSLPSSAGTLASLMGPVLIVGRNLKYSGVVARAVRSICHETMILETCDDAKVWLECARSHHVIMFVEDGDRSYVDLVKYIGSLAYTLPVVLIGEKDKVQRGAMRIIASDLRMTFYTFPHAVELGVLRVILADQRAKTAGLPVAHIWGGVKVDTVVARYRKNPDGKRSGRPRPTV